MRVCIPSMGVTPEDKISAHFGSAPTFIVYDTETDRISVLQNNDSHHAHGTCHPMAQLASFNIDCVVCGGMGRRAIMMLNNDGVKIYRAGHKTLGEVINQVKNNELVEMTPDQACAGHGHQSQFGQGPCGHQHPVGFGQNGGQGRNRKN